MELDFFRVDHYGVAPWRMPKRSSKKKDINETAFSIVQYVTGQSESAHSQPTKNPSAVSLGRLGGLKGGVARAKNLSAEQRKEIARKAAEGRWRKKEK